VSHAAVYLRSAARDAGACGFSQTRAQNGQVST